MADSKVWENARDSGRLDGNVARSLLTGYLAAVDWPANFWQRWLLLLRIKIANKTDHVQWWRRNLYLRKHILFDMSS